MSDFLKVFLVLVLGVFSSSVFAVDTLEVFAMRVQFAKESPDNSLTTGNGRFDSDTSKQKSYSLDPRGRRGSVPYWKKHFDFANAYFNAASHGNVVIKARVFPENSDAYELKKQIIDYNRTSKLKGEKTAEFDDARSRDYLQFVYDAVMAAHSSGESPFDIPLSKNSNTKRAFMIIHAGASRLVDGGSMGTKHADTPADFMDVYIDQASMEYLPDSLKNISFADSIPNGILLDDAQIDTLNSIMVVSETASQDGLNWGINGILVNQIARELGLPNTYDVVKGTSRLGYYDLMDFAGYNAGNGFFPSMPSAWSRAYMGWSSVKEVRPVAGKPVTVDVVAAGSGLEGVEIVKVPLSASEYLFIENRQRSWNKDGLIDVVLGEDDDGTDTLVKTVPVDSLNLVFEDSVCVKGKCSVNKNKARGIIVDVSSFDAGIPASGITVWKVNEWYLRETLQYGIANFWGGDTLRDHQFGLSLIESDGVLSIGKTFKNSLGEDTYDYGCGTDLLPHQRFGEKSKKYEVVKSIGATGYANTMTTQGGYTGIKIAVDVPEKARQEKSSNSFMGDSVINYGALKMKVTISIDDGSIEGSEFPREIGLNTAVRGAVFLDNSKNPDEKLLIVGAENGTVQAFSALGDTLFMSTSDLKKPNLSKQDSEKVVPLYELYDSSYTKLVGMASNGKQAVSLHEGALRSIEVESDGTLYNYGLSDFGNDFKATAGPIIDNYGDGAREGQVWFAGVDKSGKSMLLGVNLGGFPTFSAELPENFTVHDMALCEGPYTQTTVTLGQKGSKTEHVTRNYMVMGGTDGRLMIALPESDRILMSEDDWKFASDEKINVACTDMDRDGTTDVIFVGSRGSVGYVPLEENRNRKFSVLKKQYYKRGSSGNSGLKDETSGIAIGDINDDGYPEVVFLGDNLVYALDRFGIPLPGFPVVISRGSPVYGFFSDPLIVDVTGDDVPEILVPSSDGLVYAFTGKGRQVTEQFPLAAGSFEYLDTLGTIYPMSIFVADAVSDKKSAGPELYAFHRSAATAFRLQKASSNAAENAAAWTLPAGNSQRTGFFDASKLKKVEEVKAKDEITEFFIYPNPVRGGNARVRFTIGAAANSATIEFYDITGLKVAGFKIQDLNAGRNDSGVLDLKNLGSDVYTVRLKVDFKSGKTKQKKYRVGVIR